MSWSAKHILIGFICAVVLVVYFDLVFLHPSASRILFIQTVTFTRKVPLEVFAQQDPSIVSECLTPLSFCNVFQLLFTTDEWQRMRRAARAALGSEAPADNAQEGMLLHPTGGVFVDASRLRTSGQHFTELGMHNPKALPPGPTAKRDAGHEGFRPLVADQTSTVSSNTNKKSAVALVTVSSSLHNAHLRFSSKNHVIHQLQLVYHYPASYFICVTLGLCSVPWVTANAVTGLHVVLAFMSAYFFYRASRAFSSSNSNSFALQDDCDSGAVTRDGVLPSLVMTDSGDEEEMVPSALHRNPSMSIIEANSSAGGAETSTSILSQESQQHRVAGGSIGSGASCAVQRRRRLILVGTILFAVRNLLDTLDGVIARHHRAMFPPSSPLLPQAISSNSGLTFGMNGHTLDTVCDFAGGLACCLGILSVMWSQPLLLSRMPRLVMAKLSLRQTIRHHASLPRWIAFLGLLYTSAAAAGWDVFMIRYVNLFDVQADGNDAMFALENNFHVRLNQFLWALSCADSVFTLITVGLLLDHLWFLLQVFVFIGYPWLIVLNVYSLYVWHWVVLPATMIESVL